MLVSALIKRDVLKILLRSLCHGHPALFTALPNFIRSFQTLPLFLSQEQTKQAGFWEDEVILVTNPDFFSWSRVILLPEPREAEDVLGHSSSGLWELLPAHPQPFRKQKGTKE